MAAASAVIPSSTVVLTSMFHHHYWRETNGCRISIRRIHLTSEILGNGPSIKEQSYLPTWLLGNSIGTPTHLLLALSRLNDSNPNKQYKPIKHFYGFQLHQTMCKTTTYRLCTCYQKLSTGDSTAVNLHFIFILFFLSILARGEILKNVIEITAFWTTNPAIPSLTLRLSD